MSVGVLTGNGERPMCDVCGIEPAAAVVRDKAVELHACAVCLFVGVEELAERRQPNLTVRVELGLRVEGYDSPTEAIQAALAGLLEVGELHSTPEHHVEVVRALRIDL